ITTPTGHEFLLQADDFSTISKWHDAIKKAVDSLSRGSGGQGCGRALFQRSNSTECLPRPTCEASKPRAKETKSEHRRSIMFKLNYSASDSADKNGVKNRLKKFISRRPSMKTLQEKGLIKGLETDGIYRVSGNLAVIQKLRFLVDQEEELDLGDSQWEDIHVITGALKMFFRELPEPLFPFRFFNSFVEAISEYETDSVIPSMLGLEL
ncbi:hypothetical protein DNTS_021201, partial [Danionella cerebrum]